MLSRWIPKGIVSCSHKGVVVHQALGYASEKFRDIANGYDLRIPPLIYSPGLL